MSAVLGLSKKDRSVLLDPVIINNPIGVQVLALPSGVKTSWTSSGGPPARMPPAAT